MAKNSMIVAAVLIILGFVEAGPDCSKSIDTETILESCCEQPKWEDDAGIETKCKSSDLSCIAECMLNETHVLLNGRVDMARVRSTMQSDLEANPEFIPTMINAFEACTKKMDTMPQGIQPPMDGACNPYSMQLMSCVNTHSLANCPQGKFKKTTECNAAKDFVNFCF